MSGILNDPLLYEHDTGGPLLRTSAKGTLTPSGLTTGGLDTLIALSDSAWTALPSSPLSGRNSIQIQNQSDVDIKTKFVNTGDYSVGCIVSAGGSQFYDITDSILIYGRSSSGSANVLVREIA